MEGVAVIKMEESGNIRKKRSRYSSTQFRLSSAESPVSTLVPLAVEVHELLAGNSTTGHVFTLSVDDLRVRACADGVVVGFVGVQGKVLMKREVVPVVTVAVPWQCFDTPRIVRDFGIFRMSACSFARIGVKLRYRDCLIWFYCSIMHAEDRWIGIFVLAFGVAHPQAVIIICLMGQSVSFVFPAVP